MGIDDAIDKQAEKSFWHAHLVLDEYSKTGDIASSEAAAGSLSVEQAALRVIALCARDTYRLSPQKISSIEKQNALADNEITVAGIAMGRHDIGLPEKHPDETAADKTKPLRFESINNFTFTSVNRNGDPEYDKGSWERERLAHLDRCLDAGANIICLGEFDFPPTQAETEDTAFEEAILNKINARDFPVMVVAGTRHEYDEEEPTCHNVARIIVNNALNTAPVGHTKPSVYRHNKVVPAAKVGERLTPPDGIEAKYYDTAFGRIAVLICVDAYNPSLMFSLFDPKVRRRVGPPQDESDRLDFILVPSYNFSPKLYYSCQVLSLLTKSTVLLVDACSHWSENEELKCEEVELFFNGRSVRDRLIENDEIGSSLVDDRHVKIWRLKKNFLRSADAEVRDTTPTPAFDALSSYLGNF